VSRSPERPPPQRLSGSDDTSDPRVTESAGIGRSNATVAGALVEARLVFVTHNPHELPDDLPIPTDDGACQHLLGSPVPRLRLEATTGDRLDLAELADGRSVIFIYPRTGVPGVEPPTGWDLIPGARGCTPQSCAYRDDHAAFREHGAQVFGLSAQTGIDQREFAAREHIPFPLLSDPGIELGSMLDLPTFVVDGAVLYRRVTLIVESGTIAYVRYPVFPPDSDARATLSWLEANPR
jgi:peroxiredoxin